MPIKKIGAHDEVTGEVLGPGVWAYLPDRPQHFKEDWLVMFQEGLAKIAKMNLSKNAQKVFMYLLSQAAYDNYILLSQGDVARELSIDVSNASKAFKELKNQGVIVVTDKTPGTSLAYRINSHYAWKGTAKQLSKVRPIDPR